MEMKEVCRILKVEDPGFFYCESIADAKQVSDAQRSFQKKAEKFHPVATELEPEDRVLLNLRDECRWERGIITHRSKRHGGIWIHRVRLVDRLIIIETDDVRLAPHSVFRLPYAVFKLRLYGIHPNDKAGKWSKESTDTVRVMLTTRRVEVLVKSERDGVKYGDVRFRSKTDFLSLAHFLLLRGDAASDSQRFSLQYQRRENYAEAEPSPEMPKKENEMLNYDSAESNDIGSKEADEDCDSSDDSFKSALQEDLDEPLTPPYTPIRGISAQSKGIFISPNFQQHATQNFSDVKNVQSDASMLPGSPSTSKVSLTKLPNAMPNDGATPGNHKARGRRKVLSEKQRMDRIKLPKTELLSYAENSGFYRGSESEEELNDDFTRGKCFETSSKSKKQVCSTPTECQNGSFASDHNENNYHSKPDRREERRNRQPITIRNDSRDYCDYNEQSPHKLIRDDDDVNDDNRIISNHHIMSHVNETSRSSNERKKDDNRILSNHHMSHVNEISRSSNERKKDSLDYEHKKQRGHEKYKNEQKYVELEGHQGDIRIVRNYPNEDINYRPSPVRSDERNRAYVDQKNDREDHDHEDPLAHDNNESYEQNKRSIDDHSRATNGYDRSHKKERNLRHCLDQNKYPVEHDSEKGRDQRKDVRQSSERPNHLGNSHIDYRDEYHAQCENEEQRLRQRLNEIKEVRSHSHEQERDSSLFEVKSNIENRHEESAQNSRARDASSSSLKNRHSISSSFEKSSELKLPRAFVTKNGDLAFSSLPKSSLEGLADWAQSPTMHRPSSPGLMTEIREGWEVSCPPLDDVSKNIAKIRPHANSYCNSSGDEVRKARVGPLIEKSQDSCNQREKNESIQNKNKIPRESSLEDSSAIDNVSSISSDRDVSDRSSSSVSGSGRGYLKKVIRDFKTQAEVKQLDSAQTRESRRKNTARPDKSGPIFEAVIPIPTGRYDKVVVWGSHIKPTSVWGLNDKIMSSVRTHHYKELRPIQRYSAPAILAGHSIVMVGAKGSGKTFGYILPVMDMLLSIYEARSASRGYGPLVIIVCPGSSEALQVQDICRKFANYNVAHGVVTTRIVLCHGGCGKKADMERQKKALEGCELLVTTPHWLIRNLRMGIITNLDRLRCLVIDNTDVLLAPPFDVEVEFLRKKCEKLPKEQKVQWILAGETFTPQLKRFVSRLPTGYVQDSAEETASVANVLTKGGAVNVKNDIVKGVKMEAGVIAKDADCIGTLLERNVTLLIHNQLEAAIYFGIHFTFKLIKKDKKLQFLTDYLSTKARSGRVLVVCRVADEAKIVASALSEIGLNPIQPHSIIEQDQVNKAWREDLDAVLVSSDRDLELSHVEDAELLVHYSLPTKSTATFTLRFGAIAAHYSLGRVKPTSLILIDDETQMQVPKIVNRFKNQMDSELIVYAQEIMTRRDLENPIFLLCERLLSRGECLVRDCKWRHTIVASRDRPDPTLQGVIVFKPVHVIDGSAFGARVISTHAASGNRHEFVDLYPKIMKTMAAYFRKDDDKWSLSTFVEGELCAVRHQLDPAVPFEFYRAQIIQIVKKHERTQAPVLICVKLIDVGILVEVKVSDMWELPDTLAVHPAQAVSMYLNRIVPCDFDLNWSETARVALKKMLERPLQPNERWQACIRFALRGGLVVDQVSVIRHLQNVDVDVTEFSLEETLFEEGYGVKNPDHVKFLIDKAQGTGISYTPLLEKRGKLPLPKWAHFDGDLPEVVFGCVRSTNTLFLKNAKFITILDELEKDCAAEAGRHVASKKKFSVRRGDICLVQDCMDVWGRGRVDDISDDGSATCFFVDHGDSQTLPLTKFVPISRRLITRLPFQAIECTLGGIEHTDAIDVVDKLQFDFCNDGIDTCMVLHEKQTMRPLLSGGNLYAVNLLDSNGRSFNKLAVDEGLVAAAPDAGRFIEDLEMMPQQERKVIVDLDDVSDNAFNTELLQAAFLKLTDMDASQFLQSLDLTGDVKELIEQTRDASEDHFVKYVKDITKKQNAAIEDEQEPSITFKPQSKKNKCQLKKQAPSSSSSVTAAFNESVDMKQYTDDINNEDDELFCVSDPSDSKIADAVRVIGRDDPRESSADDPADVIKPDLLNKNDEDEPADEQDKLAIVDVNDELGSADIDDDGDEEDEMFLRDMGWRWTSTENLLRLRGLWRQNDVAVRIRFDVMHVCEEKVKVLATSTSFVLRCETKNGRQYKATANLWGSIKWRYIQIVATPFEVRLLLPKGAPGVPWPQLLDKLEGKPLIGPDPDAIEDDFNAEEITVEKHGILPPGCRPDLDTDDEGEYDEHSDCSDIVIGALKDSIQKT